ncbi:MAG: hypothetical protein ACC608_06770 [Anaerofustis sp.]
MKQEPSYRDNIHKVGRIWTVSGLIMLLLVPTAICIRFQAWPELSAVAKGLLGIIPIFWTVGVIEVLTFVPMLGTGGAYLGFMTGNLSNLKVPCALNAMQNAKVESGTDEGEVISTIAIAVSSIVTTVIIALGVLLLAQIQPFLESEMMQPAFDNILPALFGGLGVVYISRNFKIALVPMIFMIALFVIVPSMASSVGILVPVGALIAIGVARLMYKKNML